MWIFLPTSYLSIVAHSDQPNMLLVRARVAGDIERVLPAAKVIEIADADYHFRTVVTADELKAALCKAVDSIDYPNFKNAVPKKERKRKHAYMQVWASLAHNFGAFGVGGSPRRVQLEFPDDPDLDPNVRAFLYGP